MAGVGMNVVAGVGMDGVAGVGTDGGTAWTIVEGVKLPGAVTAGTDGAGESAGLYGVGGTGVNPEELAELTAASS